MDYGDAQASHDGQVHDMMMEDGDSVPANAISELYIESDRHAPSPIDIRYKQRKGVFVSYKVAAGILVCFLVILIVVGLVVGLAGRGRPQGDGRSSAVVDNTTFATSTLDPSIPWNNIRLPPHIKPSHYELRLTPDVDVTGVFSGTVSIVVRCQKTTDVVILHALALNITGQITVRDGATNRHIDVVEDFPFPLNEFYVLRLSESLKVNNNYVITFEEFQGGLSQDLFGLYISSYETATDDGGTTKSYIMSSQFEPTFARKAFPCFDEPAMKASFSLTVIRAPWYKSLSCTKKKSTNRLPESSLYEDVYEVTPVMSTYHLAVTLSNFDYLELVRPNGHVIRAWARPQVLEHTRFALEVANWTYGYFEEYFNRNDIITKTDLFAVPDHASLGMENWGLITFRESIMIVDVQTSSATSIFDIATVVAHEVAHMWFGNLVTPQWWDDLWLKEGFAMKFAYQSLDVIFPQWKVAELTLDLAVQPALELDAFMNSHAMTSPIENPKDISSYYDAVAYLKGQSIIHMLQYFVGDTAFQNAMRSYLAKYANSNADVDDLWREFSLATGNSIDIKETMNTWTRQQGYPVTSVSRSGPQSMRQIHVAQEYFVIKTDDMDVDYTSSPYSYKWHVLFTHITRDERRLSENWMKLDNVTFQLTSDYSGNWILGNKDLTGFYRVNYENDNWDWIIDQLSRDFQQYTASSRAAILDDAFALQRVGLLDTHRALSLTLYLNQENEYLPWTAAMRGFNYVRERMYLSESYGILQNYIKDKMGHVADRLGWTTSVDYGPLEAQEPLQQRHLRNLALKTMCENNDDDCISQALAMFTGWLERDEPVPADLCRLVYSVGVMNGGEQEWDIVWSKQQLNDDGDLRHALAHTTYPWLLWRFMEWSLDDSKTRMMHGPSNIGNVGRTQTGHALAYDFVIENWNLIKEKFGKVGFGSRSFIGRVTQLVNDESRLKQLMQLVHKDPLESKTAKMAMERIKLNIQWKTKYEAEVTQFLQDNQNT